MGGALFQAAWLQAGAGAAAAWIPAGPGAAATGRWWVLVLVFAASVYLTWGLLQAWEAWRENTVSRRLEELHRHSRRRTLKLAPMVAMEGPLPGEQEARSLRERLVAEAEARLRGGRLLEGVQRKLARARMRLRAVELLALQAGSGIVGGLAGLLLTRHWLGAVLAGFLGLWVPDLYVSWRYHRRLREFNDQLPDALTLMANSLKAGYSFLQAADVVAQELPPPIAEEFAWLVKETRVNIPLEDALANLLDRVPSRDLDLAVTAVLIQKQVGGNLAGVLERTAETIRERVRLQGQVRTLTAQGRLSGWILGLLPVALFFLLMIISPTYVAPLLQQPLGWMLLGAAGVMQVTGALVIRALIRVEV
ncbi:MAG TPA: type II secretion system F family protein [Thermaerobacter sp.]